MTSEKVRNSATLIIIIIITINYEPMTVAVQSMLFHTQAIPKDGASLYLGNTIQILLDTPQSQSSKYINT